LSFPTTFPVTTYNLPFATYFSLVNLSNIDRIDFVVETFGSGQDLILYDFAIIPEPTGLLLGAVTGSFVLFRRRRA
jgi:hypothetical protein